MLAESQDWLFFARPREHVLLKTSRLDAKSQQFLLGTPILSKFQGLWKKRWIQLSFRLIEEPGSVAGRVRVYILPHDITRSHVSGAEDNKLSQTIPQLIHQLNFSPESWKGLHHAARQGQPAPFGADHLLEDDGAGTSLLNMFNNIPSPSPDPRTVSDPDVREAMQSLLDSNVPGLQSTLYPYQRNSAALMLQREMQPSRLVDPRLRPSLDQSGNPWYYDTVTGTVLREPNYYDAPRGGILAEEMGTGKTLICLSLILATRAEPTTAPEPSVAEIPQRSRKPSLMDIAAATANKHSVAWRPYFEAFRTRFGLEFENCIRALERPENRAFYTIRNEALPESRRRGRNATRSIASKEVHLSSCTLVIVPDNLVAQWRNEIKNHTTGLRVLHMTHNRTPIPQATILLTYDVIIFSLTRFELVQRARYHPVTGALMDVYCPLEHIRFKRCIIDEGHKLGLNGPGFKSDLMRVIERLEIAARWVVTGTPSRGLYGVDQELADANSLRHQPHYDGTQPSDTALKQEREDLQRIGNLATKYLKVRPWANTKDELGDTVADWNIYVMNERQHHKGHNRRDCLKGTLDSLIIRHRLADVGRMLPPVNEKIVVLDGSFQDKLSLNLFSMMIIFNSVQSQRTDVDYFFHPRQQKSLIQLVNNLRQASFFGGSFFSAQDIAKALQTAEEFLERKEVHISAEDEKLINQAIEFGKLAASNRLKDVSNQFHQLPIYLEHFPGGDGKSWSLDERGEDGEPVCTDAGLVLALQKYLNPCIDAPTSLQVIIDSGRLNSQGKAERSQELAAAAETEGRSTAQLPLAENLAGNTPLGDDRHAKLKSGTLDTRVSPTSINDQNPNLIGPGSAVSAAATGKIEIAEPLAKARIISTASAKLTYLVDQIVKYQDDEQIIVFYDNNNIAYYLAGVLEIVSFPCADFFHYLDINRIDHLTHPPSQLQIQHLIYTRAGLNAVRRAQYITTFTEPGSRFRVLLMDISQAAFGLDMRSASRIYFVSPVLNPQVEAQAVGRARRISQQKPVTVETLVLRGSIEELIVDRRRHMSRAEHRRIASVLDDRPMYEWILNARILPMGDDNDGDGGTTGQKGDKDDGLAQTARLKTPQFVFGRGFGRPMHPDEGLLPPRSPEANAKTQLDAPRRSEPGSVNDLAHGFTRALGIGGKGALKRQRRPAASAPSTLFTTNNELENGKARGDVDTGAEAAPSNKRRTRVVWADEEAA